MMLRLDSTQYTLLNSFIHLTWCICISRDPIISKSHLRNICRRRIVPDSFLSHLYSYTRMTSKKKRGGKMPWKKNKRLPLFFPSMLYGFFFFAMTLLFSSSKTFLRDRPGVLHPWPGPAAAWSRWSSWRYRGTLRCSGRGRRTRPCWARPRGSRRERTSSGKSFAVFFFFEISIT